MDTHVDLDVQGPNSSVMDLLKYPHKWFVFQKRRFEKNPSHVFDELITEK